jgi:hypothetical protein
MGKMSPVEEEVQDRNLDYHSAGGGEDLQTSAARELILSPLRAPSNGCTQSDLQPWDPENQRGHV